MQAQDRFRVNLFKVFAPLQQFARSSLWPDDINFKLTAYIYPAFVLLLLLGPQERSTNFGLNLFWCYWWPLSFVVYPFLGRIWCSGELLVHMLTGQVWAGRPCAHAHHRLQARSCMAAPARVSGAATWRQQSRASSML